MSDSEVQWTWEVRLLQKSRPLVEAARIGTKANTQGWVGRARLARLSCGQWWGWRLGKEVERNPGDPRLAKKVEESL